MLLGHNGQENLFVALSAVPDPRDARGIRYRLPTVVGLALAAVLAGSVSVYAIGQWIAGCSQKTLAGRWLLRRALAALRARTRTGRRPSTGSKARLRGQSRRPAPSAGQYTWSAPAAAAADRGWTVRPAAARRPPTGRRRTCWVRWIWLSRPAANEADPTTNATRASGNRDWS
ncbi:transposase family protein [Micromonospora zamorensis]|uniref:transposase family protein n=1 Tax=Micromonospora zamorensis TaxID=709883 RepID=UPI00399D79AB